MRFSIIHVEAVEAIMHLKGISGAFDNCFWLVHLNPFQAGTPNVLGLFEAIVVFFIWQGSTTKLPRTF